MENSKRFRFPKTTVVVLTFLYIIIILLTHFLFNKGNAKECAQQLLLIQCLGLIVQLFLNYWNFRSQSKIVILATLFISSMILLSVISSFFSFRMLCEVYPI